MSLNSGVHVSSAGFRFPDLGDPEDATSGTLDGVMWMSAFVVKVHEDHFATGDAT